MWIKWKWGVIKGKELCKRIISKEVKSIEERDMNIE